MKVVAFNTKKGIFDFELGSVDTLFHSHPAVEIVIATKGSLTIETPNSLLKNISFAIIDSNVTHRISSSEGGLRLLMIECSPLFLTELLDQFGIELKEGIYTSQINNEKSDLITSLSQLYSKKEIPKTNNDRIKTCFEYMDSTNADYKQMIQTLKSKLNLSESRLSHVFKKEVGLSLKKYLVWSRLKRAFHLFITDSEINLYEASIKSGFYDQAHLSKAFKQMLGLSPSKVYNSRMIQDS